MTSQNILITGGCGFIASNFINYYFYKNPHVKIINVDAMYYCALETNILEEIRMSSRYTFVKGNICSIDLISNILENNNIDTVIHFAAQSHVQNSFDDSLQYTQDNILGTHTLLESCRKYGKVVKFIHISTDEVYG
jgi:nucleoside-diphosphate-sugar epimerase